MKNRASFHLKNLILSSMFLAIGLCLPFLTGQIPQIGSMLLPMHIPVFLCGLCCSPWWGLTVGLILPILRSLLFTVPVLYPNALSMAAELATYGLVAGLCFSLSRHKCILSLYRSLLIAMLAGRAVWGIAQVILLGIKGTAFPLSVFFAGAFGTALPGIILQLILIPSLMLSLGRTHLLPRLSKGEHAHAD